MGFKARWQSGAEASTEERLKMDISRGYDLEMTFTRPKDAPNLEIDVAYAIEVQKLAMERQRNAIMRQQAEAARKAAEAAQSEAGMRGAEMFLKYYPYKSK